MRKICLRCGAKFGSQAEYCPHDGTLLATDEDVPDPLLGALLLEQFRIEELIGVGGMGAVYRAHQTTVGRDVAIKVLRSELARDEQAVVRFEREARVATALDHPNLVRVFLSGRLLDGRLYIVMELLEGRSLADELDERGPPSLDRAVIMIMKLCAGLEAVHSAGIVHRDIKPENIYLVQRGRDPDFVKLVDFGVARILEADGTDPATTQNGRVFGTATYISPEAAIGEDTDHRSDIYSLGVLSYQLLTGELPFEGSTAGAILMKHVHEEPPPLHSTGRGDQVPADVARVVMRALSKDPADRPQTLTEFLNSLAQAAGHAGLLKDARTLLLGTVWGDELAAPGSYLAEILSASSHSSFPPALDDTQRLIPGLAPDDEALLLSAPKPFGTTSHDLAPARRTKRRRHGWLWAALGLLAVVVAGVVTGTWLHRTAPTAPAAAPDIASPSPAREDEAPVADVSTGTPIIEQGPPQPAVEGPPAQETEPSPPTAFPEPAPASKPAPKPKKRIRKKPRTAPKPQPEPTVAPTPEAPAAPSTPASETEPVSETEPALESDEGIDWTVPDFPDPPPTGTPDTPPRNPVIIDQPP